MTAAHLFVPSGDYLGMATEVCGDCGLTARGPGTVHPVTTQTASDASRAAYAAMVAQSEDDLHAILAEGDPWPGDPV